MKNKLKYLIIPILTIAISLTVGFSANAETEDNLEPTKNEAIVEENLFSRVYSEVSEYAGEILCAMTFAGSLVLAFAYKKGLLPLVEGSLLAISNSVSKIKESTKETQDQGARFGESIESGINGTKELLESLEEKISSLDLALKKKLDREKNEAFEREKLQIVVKAQIDMLYDVFMSSALPQYQKDAVGERIAKMKEALVENADG